ncbi:hypothetical protein TYRP_002935 [Tyrophagus putrescentiae]|nr:hypothetical protein TYRP_002935 [Tyrophagus putrescentiae]
MNASSEEEEEEEEVKHEKVKGQNETKVGTELAQPRQPRLQTEAHLVEDLVAQVARRVQQVVGHPGVVLNLVGRLLEVANLANDVRNLVQDGTLTILILEKFSRPSSVKLGVPSSMKLRSVRYMPSFSQVRFSRKTEELVKAAQICRTPLKLCRQRQMSATAAHFSITETRFGISGRRRISEATIRLTSLKCFVISRM